MQIGGGPIAVTGDKRHHVPLGFFLIPGRDGQSDDPEVRRPAVINKNRDSWGTVNSITNITG